MAIHNTQENTFSLDENPLFAFVPGYNEFTDMPQQIRIVFAGIPGYVNTTLSAANLDQAEHLCNVLNRRMNVSPEQSQLLQMQSMQKEDVQHIH